MTRVWIGLVILVLGILIRLLTALHPFVAVACVVAGYILWFTSPPVAAVWRRPDTPKKMIGVFALTVLSIGVLAAILVWILLGAAPHARGGASSRVSAGRSSRR